MERPPERSTYLEQLTHRLREAGIPAFDLTDRLKTEAHSAIKEHRLVYWSDDTHWNPAGTSAGADALSHWLSSDQVLR
jgi:hypothetical protein